MKIVIVQADYANPVHQRGIIDMMSEYSQDPMGGAEPLSDFTRSNLIPTLSRVPSAFSILALEDNKAIGLVNCFETISTFACQPLINIHDLAVAKSHRGKKISTRMLEKVESVARARQACKLTLEVLEGNTAAKIAYEKFGFSHYQLGTEAGNAMFWQKKLA